MRSSTKVGTERRFTASMPMARIALKTAWRRGDSCGTAAVKPDIFAGTRRLRHGLREAEVANELTPENRNNAPAWAGAGTL